VAKYLTVEAEETEQWQKKPWIDREGDTMLQTIHPPGELKDPLWRLLRRRTTSTGRGTRAPLAVGGTPSTLLNLMSLGLAVEAVVPP
jgi:hypothetical protein